MMIVMDEDEDDDDDKDAPSSVILIYTLKQRSSQLQYALKILTTSDSILDH